MSASWRGAGLFLFWLLTLTGCSTVHVDVSRDLDWNRINSVALEAPDADPWQLAPLIAEELRDQGFTVVSAEVQSGDLLLRYATREKPDLDAEGNFSERLESVHLQFLDPATGKRRAVIDYFYPTTDGSHSIADGIEEALADLRNAGPAQKTSSKQPATAPAPSPASAASTKGGPEENSPASMTEQATALPPEARTESSEPAADEATPVPTSAVEASGEEPRPQTRSPWIPRFHSWGFDDWGDDEATDLGY